MCQYGRETVQKTRDATPTEGVNRMAGSLGGRNDERADSQLSVQFPYNQERTGGDTRKSLIFRIIMARPAGIEPATPAFGGQYSIH